MSWIFAFLVLNLAWRTRADVVIQVQESGRILSQNLNEFEDYEYRFNGFPDDNTLLLFNITVMTGVHREDFRIYNSPIEGRAPSCWIYKKKDGLRDRGCVQVWKRSYPQCVLGSVTDESCLVTFGRKGSEQKLDVEYKLIDCTTGEALQGEEPGTVSGDTQEVSTTVSASPTNIDPFNLTTVLPIVFTVAVFFTLFGVIACTWGKKKPGQAKQEEVEDPPVYEEIPERVDSDIRRIEDPYNRLQTFVGPYPSQTISGAVVYNSLRRQDKENLDKPVVNLLPPRNGDQRFN